MVLTIKSYGIDAVGNTETLFACTALLSVAALAGAQEFGWFRGRPVVQNEPPPT